MDNKVLLDAIKKLTEENNILQKNEKSLKERVESLSNENKKLEELICKFHEEETKRIHEMIENRNLIEKCKKRKEKKDKIRSQNWKLEDENRELRNTNSQFRNRDEKIQAIRVENDILKEDIENKNKKIIELQVLIDDWQNKFHEEDIIESKNQSFNLDIFNP